jgi:S1-C subfamily serine protease
MNNRILKVLALLAGFSLVLFVGAVVGGGIVYGLTQAGDVLPAVKAQETDPGYGVVIASVEADGPAAEAGVVRGDILLEMDGEALEHSGDLVSYLDESEPGDEVELKVLHGDDLRTLTATLGDRGDGAYLGLLPCGGLPKEIDVDVDVRVGGPGAVIVEVMADSPAEEAGLQEDDVIMAVDGQELDAENDLADLIADYKPGDIVTLKIERPDDEGPFEMTVELSEHPDKEGAAYLGVRYGSLPRIDVFRGGPLPFGELEEFEFDELPFAFPEGEVKQGAVIQRVFEDSPASAAGLAEGDVITAIDGEAIGSPQSLTDAIAEREPGDRITLTVYQRDSEEEREIEVALAEHPDEEGKAYLGVLIGGFFRLERHHLEGDERPYDFDLDLDLELLFDELPFDLDDLPHHFRFELPLEEWHFDLEELPERFEFRWPPDDYYREEPGWPGDSI